MYPYCLCKIHMYAYIPVKHKEGLLVCNSKASSSNSIIILLNLQSVFLKRFIDQKLASRQERQWHGTIHSHQSEMYFLWISINRIQYREMFRFIYPLGLSFWYDTSHVFVVSKPSAWFAYGRSDGKAVPRALGGGWWRTVVEKDMASPASHAGIERQWW